MSRLRTKSTSAPPANSSILRFGDGDRHRLAAVLPIAAMLPALEGSPVTVAVREELHVKRGRLAPEGAGAHSVSGAANIRARQILLESALFDQPAELRRILVHELFHFVWVRLPNQVRREYEEIVRREIEGRARGELGWSAEQRKFALSQPDSANRTRKWRDYICESFCDTAGWWFGSLENHPEFTLARRHRTRRADWYRNFASRGRRIAL